MSDPTILEQAVLATVVLHPDRFDAAAAILTTDDFVRAGHGLLWGVLAELHARGRPDLPTVIDATARAGDIVATTLTDVLAVDTPAVSLLERHCHRVVAESMTRRIGYRLGVAVQALSDGAEGSTVAEALRDDLKRLSRPIGVVPDD